MDANMRWLGIGVIVCAVTWGAASGDIVNGDFAKGFTDPDVGWERYVLAFPSDTAVAEVTGGELHLKTEATWVYDHDSSTWVPATPLGAAIAQVWQQVPADANGFYAPPDTTGLEFDANVSIIDAPGNTSAWLKVFVTYYADLGSGGAGDNVEPAPEDQALPEGAGTYTIDMPGLMAGPDPNNSGIRIDIEAFSYLDSQPDPGLGESYTITIDARLDNFVLIPEPVTVGVLVIGGAGVLLRRRRQA